MILKNLRQLSRTVEKLNTEVDYHVFKDYEVVPRTLRDQEIPPNDLCKLNLKVDNLNQADNSFWKFRGYSCSSHPIPLLRSLFT